MKKVAIIGALLVLAGCAEVENYHDVVKTPAPAGLEGYWQSKGPQRKLVSPEAIASLVVTKEGDTLDCRPVAARYCSTRQVNHAVRCVNQCDG
ncbi:lipoprotein [Salmonella bongori]|nr:lipoprotein [Salmonella bongori]